MDIGVGLDATLNLSFADQANLAQEAARLGYTNIWTPEGTGQDSFQLCSHRWAASCQVTPEGLITGIGVSPVLYRTPVAFAMSGGTVSQLTGGRFVMGIGAGGAYRPRTRQSLGLSRFSTLALMRAVGREGYPSQAQSPYGFVLVLADGLRGVARMLYRAVAWIWRTALRRHP